jgi:hypothetical protein
MYQRNLCRSLRARSRLHGGKPQIPGEGAMRFKLATAIGVGVLLAAFVVPAGTASAYITWGDSP